MTLQELYANIGGDYSRAVSVLRIEKLIDKHIRKFPNGGVPEAVIAAGETMDPTQLFETSHAMKGVCFNLGLVKMGELASEISEEFRPGNPRTHTDEEVEAIIAQISALYDRTAQGIRAYEESAQ
ncbi:MAG: Hpt domain-containing protein [Clostridia bacterium]|nr:Hpt domain-containing protein [Clostridia bacterium]